jgi:hypothetical protein
MATKPSWAAAFVQNLEGRIAEIRRDHLEPLELGRLFRKTGYRMFWSGLGEGRNPYLALISKASPHVAKVLTSDRPIWVDCVEKVVEYSMTDRFV